MFVWLIGNFVRDQFWEMDNIKIFYGFWIPIAVLFVAQFLLLFVKQSGYICTFEYVMAPCDIFKKEDCLTKSKRFAEF
jgi:hypothetical protein